MKIRSQHKVAFLLIFGLSTYLSNGQSLPVGTPLLGDYYRRAQLLGKVDSSISFTSKPFFPIEALKLNNSFDPDQKLERERKKKFNE